MDTKVHFSSKTDQWETPYEFFEQLNEVYKFDIDVCADYYNKKCQHFFDDVIDGLSQDWHPKTCWMNPPYGRDIGKWMEKAYKESQLGATVVCLVPSRTDTKWWHNYAMKGDITFIKGRLKFGRCKNAAPFPNAVVVFKPQSL